MTRFLLPPLSFRFTTTQTTSAAVSIFRGVDLGQNGERVANLKKNSRETHYISSSGLPTEYGSCQNLIQ